MSTVATSTTTRKSFYAHLFDEPGLLFQHTDGRILFLNETNDRITTIEPDMINFLTVLGQVAVANEQRLTDLGNGGAATIACTRTPGRA
jgi:hypothetical protein